MLGLTRKAGLGTIGQDKNKMKTLTKEIPKDITIAKLEVLVMPSGIEEVKEDRIVEVRLPRLTKEFQENIQEMEKTKIDPVTPEIYKDDDEAEKPADKEYGDDHDCHAGPEDGCDCGSDCEGYYDNQNAYEDEVVRPYLR